MKEIEEWRDVPGYERLYQVSNQGRVRVLDRHIRYPSGKTRFKPGHELKPQAIGKLGHLKIVLYKNSNSKSRLVHHLVLEAFVGARPDGMECCHGDGNPINNKVENLRWDTSAANNADKTLHGTQNTGSKHGLAKLDEFRVAEIKKRLDAGESQRSIAVYFGIHQVNVSKINRGLLWSHVEG
ncbi:MAG: NUMOD4 motif-containing HNH endonuclease [Betaproteobacteria bacterium]|nr:NUMOD4 motif-containing HNH endonuclease [Betaproteobacteria bacterium]